MHIEKDFFFIGEIAKRIGVHEQTIRMYEKRGLIKPDRTKKNIRLFNKKDLNRITLILTLTQEVGMKLSGVKLVFSLAKSYHIDDDELFDFVTDHVNELLNK